MSKLSTRSVAEGLRQVGRYLLPAILVLPVFSLVAAGLAAGTIGGSDSAATAALPQGGAAPAQVVAYTSAVPQGAVSPYGSQPVFFLSPAPNIVAGATPPHGDRGPCRQCHTILPRPSTGASTPAMYSPVAQPQRFGAQPQRLGTQLSPSLPQAPGAAVRPGSIPGSLTVAAPAASPSGPGAAAAVTPSLKMTPYQRVFWQGLELVPLGHSLAAALGVPDRTHGVVVASASLPAGAEGFSAGDVVVAVDNEPTPDLQRFWDAARAVRAQPSAKLSVLRAGQRQTMVLRAPGHTLGSASGVTAPVIVEGSQPPHGSRGACASCHMVMPRAGGRP